MAESVAPVRRSKLRAGIAREQAAIACLITARLAARLRYFDQAAMWLGFARRNLDAASQYFGFKPPASSISSSH